MNLYKPDLEQFQAVFLKDEAEVSAFIESISRARFAPYLSLCGGNSRKAIDLYFINIKLSQALYVNFHIWEVALRNKINDFLCWKYNAVWPFDEKRFLRNLQGNDKRRLLDAVERQTKARGGKRVPTDAIVADLSAGFWVSLLTKSYDVPFSWRYNIARIFPNEKGVARDEMSAISDKLLNLRNRIAHHEPIHHLALDDRRKELERQIAAMCSASAALAAHACTFAAPWKLRAHLELKSAGAHAASPRSN